MTLNTIYYFFKGLLIEELDEVGYTKVHSAAFNTSIKNLYTENYNGDSPCASVFNRISIQHDGGVILCPHDYNGDYNFGNVMETHILDIFNSQKFNEIRKIHEDKQRFKIEKCSKCDEPELDLDGDMYAKYTPSGKKFFAKVYTGFDHDEARKKAI